MLLYLANLRLFFFFSRPGTPADDHGPKSTPWWRPQDLLAQVPGVGGGTSLEICGLHNSAMIERLAGRYARASLHRPRLSRGGQSLPVPARRPALASLMISQAMQRASAARQQAVPTTRDCVTAAQAARLLHAAGLQQLHSHSWGIALSCLQQSLDLLPGRAVALLRAAESQLLSKPAFGELPTRGSGRRRGPGS